MTRNKHLSVVIDVYSDPAIKAALTQVASHIPREVVAVTHWDAPEAVAFFEAMHTVVLAGRMGPGDIEEAVGITGAADAYWEWLGEQG